MAGDGGLDGGTSGARFGFIVTSVASTEFWVIVLSFVLEKFVWLYNIVQGGITELRELCYDH